MSLAPIEFASGSRARARLEGYKYKSVDLMKVNDWYETHAMLSCDVACPRACPNAMPENVCTERWRAPACPCLFPPRPPGACFISVVISDPPCALGVSSL